MKKILTLIMVWICAMGVFAQAPDWVNRHPVSEDTYHGVGMAPLTDEDYKKKAQDNALADIAGQIATKLESNSLFQVLEVGEDVREMFDDQIKSSMAAWFEGQRLVDTYQNEDFYYVYFTLNKKEYRKNAEKRRKEVLNTAIGFFTNAMEAQRNMDLLQALDLFAKGLEAVEPWTFMDLTENGVNLPVELYNGYMNVFSGLAITSNVSKVKGESFKALSKPIVVCLKRNGEVVPNVKLKVDFLSGNANMTTTAVTDQTGLADFYVKNITSKENLLELVFSLDDSFFAGLPQTYRKMLESKSLPSVKVVVEMEPQSATAYFKMNANNDIEGCERPLRGFLGNEFFTLVKDRKQAQCLIDVSTVLEFGNTVTGGMYDLNTCLCTLHIKIYNNRTKALLLDYSINQHKVMIPVSKSAEQSMGMCVRELMKRAKRELPGKIKKMNIH